MNRKLIKAFREHLNQKYGHSNERHGSSGHVRYAARTRLYGDYLYHTDRGMFNNSLSETLAGRLEADFVIP
ncbi:hypothetical protein ACI3QN_12675, partial [Propionibacterium freudenreichii]|uniref:hypothetical protein n=1 Tax=Propionibacterium freudenreichii TaxID=1744 RepID=UPI003854271D